MGDKFNSGGGDEQVAKDQATFVNVNDQVKSVNQHTVGNANILAGNDLHIGEIHFHDKVGGIEKFIPNDTQSYENIPRIFLAIKKNHSKNE